MSSLSLGIQNIFSRASREQCIMNLKKFHVAKMRRKGVQPSASAAVLVPLCSINDIPSLLYTVRSANLKSHSGQISFPGGKTDNNETPMETALRETQEEIGLLPNKIDIWGCGPELPGKDNRMGITPVIGLIDDLSEDDLTLNKNEVSEVFAVPLQELCHSKNQYYTQFANGITLPVFVADEYKIWGITAYITHMVLSCLLSEDVYRNNWMQRKIDMKYKN